MKRLLLASTLAVGAASLAGTPALANEALMKEMANSKQWAIQTGDYTNQRYSKLDQINKDNVKDLSVAWTFSTGVLRGHEGSPLVIGDTMYLHTPFPNNVFALDLNNDGIIKWSYEPKQDPDTIPVMCCDTVNRGLAYADGKIFLHQADTTVVALDANTGKVVWSVKNGDPAKGETNTATVMPVKDKLIVGISGGEFGVRGHLTAYSIADGSMIWRGYSIGPDSVKEAGVKARFVRGGSTQHLVELLSEGLTDYILDGQTFDLAGVASIGSDPNHIPTSPFTSYNWHGKGNFASMIDAVVLGATEVDVNYNANVVTHSDGLLLHGIGGRGRLSPAAPIITAP